MLGDSLYSIVVVVGPIVLIAAIAYAMLRNRTTARQDARTEQATRRMYEEQAADDRARSGE